jgi:acetyltransferase-like isoleucine patch superfamily enzyme
MTNSLRVVMRMFWRVEARAYRAGRAAIMRLRFLGREVHVDASSWVSLRSYLCANGGGSISIGRNSEIHPLSMIMTYGGSIKIGDECSVNPFVVLYGHGGLSIGNRVRIATHVVVIPANHNPPVDSVSLIESGVVTKGIRIDDDVWIGAGACILDGVHIGRRAIVGAGSVVTRSVGDDVTVAGVPARVIESRSAGSSDGTTRS